MNIQRIIIEKNCRESSPVTILLSGPSVGKWQRRGKLHYIWLISRNSLSTPSILPHPLHSLFCSSSNLPCLLSIPSATSCYRPHDTTLLRRPRRYLAVPRLPQGPSNVTIEQLGNLLYSHLSIDHPLPYSDCSPASVWLTHQQTRPSN